MTIHKQDEFVSILRQITVLAKRADEVTSAILEHDETVFGLPAWMALAANLFGAVEFSSDGVLNEQELAALTLAVLTADD